MKFSSCTNIKIFLIIGFHYQSMEFKMSQPEYIIVANMSRYPRSNDMEMALDYLNQLVVANVPLDTALGHVSSHFKGINQEYLHDRWNSLG